MLFNSVAYFAFLLAVLIVFYSVPGRWKKFILLFASYAFYAWWNWKFVPLLLALTLIDYGAALWIGRSAAVLRRHTLVVSICANAGFLAYFKYFNFLAGNLGALLHLRSGALVHDIVLPLGISFHTFQSISYVVDVYRRKQEPIRNLADYALYISFFPQLVAGPIVRAEEFFRDFYALAPPASQEIRRGAFLIITGLMKKVVLADNLSAVADQFFGAPGLSGAQAWGTLFAFAWQIYFDFSGYTDMAIGSALLFGFHFPENFRQPYLAVSVTDFWRRWHMSLSSWLRDYIYIPLGGNRRGRGRTYLNLMLTMLFGGLWHGAHWKFVFWGGYHGLLLSLERATGIAKSERRIGLAAVPKVLITFVLVSFGWVFFRARSWAEAMTMSHSLLQWPRGHWPIEPAIMLLLTAAVAVSVVNLRLHVKAAIWHLPLWAFGFVLGVMLFLTEIFAPDTALPFVYFQF